MIIRKDIRRRYSVRFILLTDIVVQVSDCIIIKANLVIEQYPVLDRFNYRQQEKRFRINRTSMRISSVNSCHLRQIICLPQYIHHTLIKDFRASSGFRSSLLIVMLSRPIFNSATKTRSLSELRERRASIKALLDMQNSLLTPPVASGEYKSCTRRVFILRASAYLKME